jgi:branched-chain amino acid transport system ATP-binding protein
MSLQVDRLSAGYGAHRVLREVSLVVPTGRVVAVLGANGAGKTTLLRACSGLLGPSSGTVRIEGLDVTGATPHELAGRGLCHIPEGRAVFPTLTVEENLKLMAHQAVDAPLDRAFEAFPILADRRAQVAGTMSGGEQQMLALARAYVTEARYVLLDEVSMGLAPLVIDQIFAALRSLADRGVALLIVEQYVAKALALADFVFVLRSGRVAFAGEPGELDQEALAQAYL